MSAVCRGRQTNIFENLKFLISELKSLITTNTQNADNYVGLSSIIKINFAQRSLDVD